MKWSVLPLFLLSVASAAELTGTHTVYLLPMTHGLDQFIANDLIRTHLLQVVTDPAKADSVFTDRVGAQLESRLNELYPPPKPPKEIKVEAKEAKAEAKETKADAKETSGAPETKEAEKKKDDDKPAAATPPPILGDTVNKLQEPGNLAAFGHGQGTIFLVDVKSRQVVWSTFEKPKAFTPHELNRTAGRIVKQLKQDLEPKPEKK